MWCPSCQADVAAELSSDNRRLACTRCACDLALAATEPSAKTLPMSPAERTARDLLARWSAEAMLEKPSDPAVAPPILRTVPEPRAATPPEPPQEQAAAQASLKSPSAERPASLALPQSQPKAAATNAGTPLTAWMTTAAQFVAYAGIAGLTYGSALCLWSHFGGPAHYAATGWLLITAGQMLMFLGFITLVADRLEQFHRRLDERLHELQRTVAQGRRHTAGRPRRRAA
jgi:hypothetical protein